MNNTCFGPFAAPGFPFKQVGNDTADCNTYSFFNSGGARREFHVRHGQKLLIQGFYGADSGSFASYYMALDKPKGSKYVNNTYIEAQSKYYLIWAILEPQGKSFDHGSHKIQASGTRRTQWGP